MNRLWAAVALVALTAAPAAAQMTPPRPVPHLDVTGRGSVDRTPDRVAVSFSIVTNDDVAARATSANNAAYGALQTKLRALGIDPASIKTTAYGISFDPRPATPNPQYTARYGFVVSRSVTVASDRTDLAGAIVDAGVAAGITNVGGVSFTVRDPQGAGRAALAAAVADARSQAEALAAAAHVRLIRILSISTAGGPPILAPRAMAVAAANIPTDLPPSELTVTASVAVSYEVAP